ATCGRGARGSRARRRRRGSSVAPRSHLRILARDPVDLFVTDWSLVDSYCFPIGTHCILQYGKPIGDPRMSPQHEVWQGTLALMVLKTRETLGPQHGYGIARRIEQTSGGPHLVN